MAQVHIAGLEVELVRKNIRSLRLTVYASDGRVRVAAPLRMPADAITAFVTSRQAWIRKQQEKFDARPRVAPLHFLTGEAHLYQGRYYPLLVQEGGPRGAQLREGVLVLTVPAGSTATQRAQVLQAWYRQQLKAQVPALLRQWEAVVGVQAREWGVKQMKTRWGTCNIRARRIWLNLELSKKPPFCLEYVIVHELVHLHERLHNARFWSLMDQFMPGWRTYQNELKMGALAPD